MQTGFSQWVVGVRLIASTNFAQVFARASAQTNALNANVAKVTASTSKFASVGKILDKSMIGVGLASAATFAIGLKGASDLQNATVQAAIAMNRTGDTIAKTTANMRQYRDIALEMSKLTGQSLPESMGVIATMASSGLSEKIINSDYKSIAKFTDILHFGKDKMDYGEAASLGAGLVHDMRLFNGKDTVYGLGRIAQLGYLSPHGTNQGGT